MFLQRPSQDWNPQFKSFLFFSPGKSHHSLDPLSMINCHKGNQSDKRCTKKNIELYNQSWEGPVRSSRSDYKPCAKGFWFISEIPPWRHSITVCVSISTTVYYLTPACYISYVTCLPWGRYSQSPHFNDQETEAQRGAWFAVLFKYAHSLRNIGFFRDESWRGNAEEQTSNGEELLSVTQFVCCLDPLSHLSSFYPAVKWGCGLLDLMYTFQLLRPLISFPDELGRFH